MLTYHLAVAVPLICSNLRSRGGAHAQSLNGLGRSVQASCHRLWHTCLSAGPGVAHLPRLMSLPLTSMQSPPCRYKEG
jgi:hypothetical protein